MAGRPLTVVVSVDTATEIGMVSFVATNGITVRADVTPTMAHSSDPRQLTH